VVVVVVVGGGVGLTVVVVVVVTGSVGELVGPGGQGQESKSGCVGPLTQPEQLAVLPH